MRRKSQQNQQRELIDGLFSLPDVKRRHIFLTMMDKFRGRMNEDWAADLDWVFPKFLPPIYRKENSVYNSATTFNGYIESLEATISDYLKVFKAFKSDEDLNDDNQNRGKTNEEAGACMTSKTEVQTAATDLQEIIIQSPEDMKLNDEISHLEMHLKKILIALTSEEEIINNCQSKDFLVDLRRYEILTIYRLEKSQDPHCIKIDLTNKAVTWILSQSEVMQKLMYSGDTASISNSIDIMKSIMEMDDRAKTGWRLNLAIAIALTFNEEVKQRQPMRTSASNLFDNGPIIDGMKRYRNFVEWAQAGDLHEDFFDLSVWHLRSVVNAHVSDEELIWARKLANIENKVLRLDKIKNDPFKDMIRYKKYRLGAHFGNFGKFYCTKWVTLQDIYKHGGACGAKSHFGAAMTQAQGLPAQIFYQPGHSSYTWYMPGKGWIFSDRTYNWSQSWIASRENMGFETRANIIPRTEIGLNLFAEKSVPISTAMTICRIMQSEWEINSGLSVLGEFIFQALTMMDSNHDAKYNYIFELYLLPEVFQDQYAECLNTVLAKELSAKSLLKQTSKPVILQIKGCYCPEKTCVIFKLKYLSIVRGIQLACPQKKKNEQKAAEIRYLYQNEIVLQTSNFSEFPDNLIDEIVMWFDDKVFNIYSLFAEIAFKGFEYDTNMIVDELLNQRYHDNEFAKMTVRNISAWLIDY